MSVIAIVLIIIAGIALLLIEFLIIPGISVFGIGGFICLIGAVISAYIYQGSMAGHITLAGTVIASLATILFTFRRKTWKKMGLAASIESKIISIDSEKIKKGDTGKAITRLAPMGKVMVHDMVCEAKSIAGFVHENTEIEVINIHENQLIVKPKII
jgi:membrane-bound ClpP family serine protease